MKPILKGLAWIFVVVLGVGSYATLALQRGEHVSSAYILIAAICTYAIGYRFYSNWLAAKVLTLNDRRATPCEAHDDGKDFVRTNKWIVFGHHFAAISGPGPLVGPVLAAQFGYLPGMLWILIGVVLGGAVQDFVVLFCSMRRDGKSLGQMVKEELNSTAGVVALVAILAILTIILAVLGLVVVKALAESPWGVFTVGATIPIAMLMGGYLRYGRVGKVREATAMGVVLLLLAVWGGKMAYTNPAWSSIFTVQAEPLAWGIIIYGLAASVLPVWLLLAPRDYLSTFMKLGTIFVLIAGIFLVLPRLQMPALSQFIDGSGPVVAGKLFPFCFITIACGAISGFHALIASGTTPKIITRESYSRSIGYGAMIFESLVAIMALIAACTLDPGIYLSVNIKGSPAETVAMVNQMGFPVTVDQMDQLAKSLGENTLFGRTGGAATLAVGMAKVFSNLVSGRGLDLWYHFAIMFEALFILTTLDAGTRVGRYLLQDALGHVWKPLGDTRKISANTFASLLVVSAWGYFLIQGVRDPLGGVNSLWPLFGIANQLLSVLALALAATIILKMELVKGTDKTGRKPRLARVWVVLAPLVFLLAVTGTAGLDKIFSSDPRIGFLAQARVLDQQLPALEKKVSDLSAAGDQAGLVAAEKAVVVNRTFQFNQKLDAVVTGIFMALVALILLLSVREWILLLTRRHKAVLHEAPVVWLPQTVLANGPKSGVAAMSACAILIGLTRELSGEAELDRARQADQMQAAAHDMESVLARARTPDGSALVPGQARLLNTDVEQKAPVKKDAETFIRLTESHFNGINRCC
jgi:carbon starvation protein